MTQFLRQLRCVTCTVTHIPKPGDQDQKGDQEECLKIPPVMTALEAATGYCALAKAPAPQTLRCNNCRRVLRCVPYAGEQKAPGTLQRLW